MGLSEHEALQLQKTLLFTEKWGLGEYPFSISYVKLPDNWFTSIKHGDCPSFLVGLLEGNSIHSPLMSMGPNGICLVCLSRHRLFGAWFGRRSVWCVLRWQRDVGIGVFFNLVKGVTLGIQHIYIYTYQHWLVVSTPLKNISQMGVLFPTYGKINKWSKPPEHITPWCWNIYVNMSPKIEQNVS